MTAPRVEVTEREPSHRVGRGVLLAAGMAAVVAVAVVGEPREHAALPAIARQALRVALPGWHTTEPVNEVVYGTRGFDTFGETFLLLAAVVGIASISRHREHRRGFVGEEAAGREERADTGAGGVRTDRAEGEARTAEEEEQGEEPTPATPDAVPVGTPAPERAEGMTVVVRGAVRLACPLLLIAGIYLVAWGYSPGGGFPGGAVILGGVLLAYVGFGYAKVRRIIRPDVIEPIELGGALLIVVIEALGLILKGSFSANFLPLGQLQTIRSGGILQAFSGAELIEVSTGLTLAVFSLLGMGHDWSDDEDDEESESRPKGSS